MRNFMLLAFIVFCRLGSAQNNARLYTADGRLFKVKIKNDLINTTAQSSVLIEHILEDTLTANLEFENNITSDVVIYLVDKQKKTVNKEFNYKIEAGTGKSKPVFTGMYDIVVLPKPLVPLKPVVDTSLKYKNTLLGHFCELKNGKPTYFNNIPKEGSCVKEMPEEYLAFANILTRKAPTEDETFIIIENICRNNCLSVRQLNLLLNYINYEIEKLKLVKVAYFNLTDTIHKKELAKSFRFESSVFELNDFLKRTGDYRLKNGDHCKQVTDTSAIKDFCVKLSVFETDAERYQLFKKQYDSYCYSVYGAKLVLKQFIHDNEKINAAKAMYLYCTERENYIGVSDLFSYNETTNVLKDFISKQNK